MKNEGYIGILILFFLWIFPLKGQMRIGEWRDHLSYLHGTHIAISDDKIFCATESALFSIYKADKSVEKLSKVTGLSDIGISTINFSPENDLLLIAYSNTNIDLIEGTQIHNISDIKRKVISGIKTINDILFIDHYAYLSCGFGIVVVNLEKKEIKDTYYIGENGSQIQVFELTSDGNFFYAATEEGIYQAGLNDPNLVNYANWHRVTDIHGYQEQFNGIISFNSRIFANRSEDQFLTDTIYLFNGLTWEPFDTRTNTKNHSFRISGDKLIISSNSLLRIVNDNTELDEEINDYGYSIPQARDALIDEEGTLWIADHNQGIVKNESAGVFVSIYPNGPFSNDVFHINIMDGKLYLAGGGRVGNTGIFHPGEIYTFTENTWQSIIDFSIRDVVSIIADPLEPDRFFAGTWGYGLLEYKNNIPENHYTDKNSIFEQEEGAPPGDSGYIRIGGLAFDAQHNLWITNSGVENPVVVKKQDGSWTSFSYKSKINAPTITDIIVTANDHKWLLLRRGYGLFAFDNNRTIDDESDDRFRKFSVIDQDGTTMNNLYSIAEDNEGHIWVGTNQGPVIYFNPENVFSEDNFRGQRVKVPRNDGSGLADYLLGTETITAISVDGANRKWVGTEDAGVFLLSEDGLRQIYNFNENNSPLLSNSITSISIDNISGEVFFGTDKGVISFRSTATAGYEDFSNVYVFPNPVRKDYHGPITITGLVPNVNVKITDISGNLVYETTALGGQAIWDGRTFSGERVHTGIYLILCTNDDGTKTHITKLLFLH